MEKIRCTCACHTSGNMMMHIRACCNDGWIDKPDLKQYLKDGTWVRYYYEDGSEWTIQHNEKFDGKLELNSDWEVITEEKLGNVYVLKPKKEIKQNENNSKESST